MRNEVSPRLSHLSTRRKCEFFILSNEFFSSRYVGIILSQEIDTVSSDGRTLLRLRIAAKEDIRQALKVLPFYCAHSQSKILPTKMKWTNCKFISFR